MDYCSWLTLFPRTGSNWLKTSSENPAPSMVTAPPPRPIWVGDTFETIGLEIPSPKDKIKIEVCLHLIRILSFTYSSQEWKPFYNAGSHVSPWWLQWRSSPERNCWRKASGSCHLYIAGQRNTWSGGSSSVMRRGCEVWWLGKQGTNFSGRHLSVWMWNMNGGWEFGSRPLMRYVAQTVNRHHGN